MLDERRKAFLQRLDIRRIKPNGVIWSFGEEIRTYQLSKEDIRYLRWYHNNPKIASEVNLNLPKRNFSIAEDRNRYNRNTRTKRKIKNKGLGKIIIIGSLTITLVLGASIIGSKTTANSDELEMTTVEIQNPVVMTGNTEEYVVGTVNIDEQVNRVETIKHLCDIYQVDFETTYKTLKELTNNFTSSDYMEGFIQGVTCKGYDVHASNEAELLTYAVRAIKQLPERFGLDESIHIHNGYSSGNNYYRQISDVCEVLGIDRNLMYAIVNAETSFNSELFNTINNPAGLRGINGTDPWWVFENKEEGFLEFGMELVKYYKMIGVDTNNVDAQTIKRIGDIHAPLSDGNENWLPNVLSGLEYAQNNEYELFGGAEIHGLGR